MSSEWIKLPQNHSHCPAAHSTYPNPSSNRLFAFDLIQPYFSCWQFLCPFPSPYAAGLGGCCLIQNPRINSLCICFSILEYCLLVFTIKKKKTGGTFLKSSTDDQLIFFLDRSETSSFLKMNLCICFWLCWVFVAV